MYALPLIVIDTPPSSLSLRASAFYPQTEGRGSGIHSRHDRTAARLPALPEHHPHRWLPDRRAGHVPSGDDAGAAPRPTGHRRRFLRLRDARAGHRPAPPVLLCEGRELLHWQSVLLGEDGALRGHRGDLDRADARVRPLEARAQLGRGCADRSGDRGCAAPAPYRARLARGHAPDGRAHGARYRALREADMRVLVTGAASGIGRATCLRLARDAGAQGRKAQIAAVDIGPSASFDSLLDELRKQNAEPLALHADMGTADGPGRAVAEVASRFGGLDGLVSNAGINRPGPLVDYAVEDWDRVFAVNTRATWLLAKAAHAALKASRGAIVTIGSMSGSNPHANLGAYGPGKAAVIMLVQVLAQEFGRDGIRVNVVSPGMVRTGMTARVYADQKIAAERDALVPIGRVAMPEDMADVVAFLLGPDARYINGHDLVVDGGIAGNFLGRLPGISQITRG